MATLLCSVPAGLIGLPLAAGGAPLNLVPPPRVPAGGILLNGPAATAPFVVSGVDGNAWALFSASADYQQYVTSQSPGAPPPLVQIG
jgi:hypothetical protein